MAWRTLLLIGLVLLIGTGRVGADEAAERRELGAQLQAEDARYERERAACSQRFALNACTDRARDRHRQAQSTLKARLRELDAKERQHRAVERQATIDGRQQTQRSLQSRPPARPGQAGPSQPGRAESPASGAPVDPSTELRQARERRRADAAAAQAKAAERAAAARQLQAEIRADQDRIKARQAQREAKGKKAHPLPPPPSAVASAPG